MGFLAKTKSSTEWKLITNVISTLVEEASFEATVEGIQFRAMDPSHVAMVDLNWPNASFEKYECDKPFKLTLRIEELSKLIKRANQNNSISISAENDEYMAVNIENGYKKKFQIRLIESSYVPQQVPKLDLDSKIHMDKSIFDNTLIDVDAVADHITIETTQDQITFSGNGDSGKAAITLNKEDKGINELTSKKESKSTYSLQYLISILKAIGSSSETITAEYSEGMPFKMEFKLGESGGFINFYLAPRIDNR
ncbi:MAG: proliferating cell nuclear antigen (pcna) [Thaumarchaeota archaeon]|jgi:proliferating cell nuclear antigen|nr:proliferating cell nuclear antigen (pcna) [Nitrososphaerota archaeon]|tara:strand:+ start:13543 stop:14301 length:759 start_codon:yes stop_codon:yes gene_type:complete